MRRSMQFSLWHRRIPLCQGKAEILDFVVKLVLSLSFGLCCSFRWLLLVPVCCDVLERRELIENTPFLRPSMGGNLIVWLVAVLCGFERGLGGPF